MFRLSIEESQRVAERLQEEIASWCLSAEPPILGEFLTENIENDAVLELISILTCEQKLEEIIERALVEPDAEDDLS